MSEALDGTLAGAVALMTGMTRAERDELGGFREEGRPQNRTESGTVLRERVDSVLSEVRKTWDCEGLDEESENRLLAGMTQDLAELLYEAMQALEDTTAMLYRPSEEDW